MVAAWDGAKVEYTDSWWDGEDGKNVREGGGADWEGGGVRMSLQTKAPN